MSLIEDPKAEARYRWRAQWGVWHVDGPTREVAAARLRKLLQKHNNGKAPECR